jgi:hypothetical protein
MEVNYLETAGVDESLGAADGGTTLAGALLASGFGRYSGPRCPHADSMLNTTATMKKEATPDNLTVDFTIRITV